MPYSDIMLQKGGEQIEQAASQEEQGAAWNYYSQFAGTGFETPGLRMKMYSIGRKKRRAEDNLSAYYQILSKQENLHDKWKNIWGQVQQAELNNPLPGE